MAENSDMKEENPEMAAPENSDASMLQIKTEKECDEPSPSMPKKRGRKKKATSVKAETKKRSRKKSTENFSNVVIKQEIMEDEEIIVECSRRSTRSLSRKYDAGPEAEPGPSIKKEPADLSSDDIDIIDDSDSDPAWTPSAKVVKGADHLKAHPPPTLVKKRGPKTVRRNSAGNGPAAKTKKEKTREHAPASSRKKKATTKSVSRKQEIVCEPDKLKKERVCVSPV